MMEGKLGLLTGRAIPLDQLPFLDYPAIPILELTCS